MTNNFERYGRSTDHDMQSLWLEDERHKTAESDDNEKFFEVDMFPYLSGKGLHVGHVRGYVAGDVVSRMRTRQGYDVLRAIGWDAYGLPAEQFALANKTHPKYTNEQNIAMFREQLQALGLSYDWDREIATTDPEFMKWTQDTFLRMYDAGLVYESEEPINWCESCKTGLSNEDLEGGACERCGSAVVQKPMRQWKIRITDYAKRLTDDLDELSPGWDDEIIDMQRNWIGLEQGHTTKTVAVAGDNRSLEDARVVDLFVNDTEDLRRSGVVSLAADSDLAVDFAAENPEGVLEMVEKLNEAPPHIRARMNDTIRLPSTFFMNPATGEWVPVVVSPSQTSEVVQARFIATGSVSPEAQEVVDLDMEQALLNHGVAHQAESLTSLRDWVFSRQRFWGEPIPLIHCDNDGVVPVPYEELPLMLPDVESYETSETGESPLASIDEWVSTICPNCGGEARRETNTMPQWAGSSWYWNRYKDPHNQELLVGEEAEARWAEVDLCIGGLEHATRHLIYARFWHKFLYDEGIVSTPEPFKSVKHVGLIMGEDGRKMGKRYGNIVDPLEIVEQRGADVLRMYIMFMGDFSKSTPWDSSGIKGIERFVRRVESMQSIVDDSATNVLSAETAQEIQDSVNSLKFNKALATLMGLSRQYQERGSISQDDLTGFLVMLSPFAPHLTESIYRSQHPDRTDFGELKWPSTLKEDAADGDIEIEAASAEVVIQINGKKRSIQSLPANYRTLDAVDLLASLDPKLASLHEQGKIRKVIAPEKANIINFVVDQSN